MTKLHLDLGDRGYDISIGRGLIGCAGEIFNLNRRVTVVTDSGVPKEYAEGVASLCHVAQIVTIPQGEESKCIENYALILQKMLDFGMTRTDCVVAVGGGVVGDLAGFAAASFMRGVDFYNVPTTLLSQVDSSIGGKTAINFGGVKNIVGAFYQPKGVIVDPDTLKTLPERQISNGMSEAIKMAASFDEKLFRFMEESEISDDIIEQIIIGSLKIKKFVVESDEREGGLRKALNLGHTLGHGIESAEDGRLFHGECVALGMTAVFAPEAKERLTHLLKKYGLPTVYDGDIDKALMPISHDKKCDGNIVSVVLVKEIGSFVIEKMDVDEFSMLVKKELK